MNQDLNTFKFVVIARNETILMSYPPDQPEMLEKTVKVLKKLDTSSPFAVIEQNNLLYTASTDSNSIVFLCVCDKSVDTPQIGKFLTTLKHQWMQNYGAISQTIAPNEKSSEFCPKIKELFDNFNEKLKPTLASSRVLDQQANAKANNVVTSNSTNVNEPLLTNHENSILPNPFAPSNYKENAQDVVNNEPEMFDEELQETRNCCNYLRRNRFIFMFVVGILLIIYFSISFYCEDFNILRCSKSK